MYTYYIGSLGCWLLWGHHPVMLGGLSLLWGYDLWSWFYQNQPVAKPLWDTFYYPDDLLSDCLSSQIGHMLYEEFTTVVELKEQRRISDPVWHDFLQHLGRGTVNAEHLKMLHFLIIGKDEAHTVDFLPSLEWCSIMSEFKFCRYN